MMENVAWIWGQKDFLLPSPINLAGRTFMGDGLSLQSDICHLLEVVWPNSHPLGSENLSERPLLYSNLEPNDSPNSEKRTNGHWVLSTKQENCSFYWKPMRRIQIAIVPTARAEVLVM